MIDVITLQIIAGILLVSSLLIIYQVNFRRKGEEEPLKVKKTAEFSSFVKMIGGLVTFLIPMGAVLLLFVVPTLVYETSLNFYFYGDTAVQVLGTVLYFGGGALLVWSSNHLGMFHTDTIIFAEEHFLVDTGPYSRVRHPGYTGTLMLAMADLLIMLNVILALNVIAVTLYFMYRARIEEEFLKSPGALGNQYLEYMRRTGRFLPKLLKKTDNLGTEKK
ncbi:MAG: methyltransferase family protein [Candidatus Thorarchaeota archaeon]